MDQLAIGNRNQSKFCLILRSSLLWTYWQLINDIVRAIAVVLDGASDVDRATQQHVDVQPAARQRSTKHVARDDRC